MMKSNHSEKLRTYLDDYHSGMYATNEVIGAIVGLLTETADFKVLWIEIPSWAQASIWEFLKDCNDSSNLYNFSSKSSMPISPRLLDLKSWLASEKGYR